jgi:ribonucleoside-triphosphate reductase
MGLQIRKRTGQLVPFDKEKIQTAICKAWHEIYPTEKGFPPYAKEIADEVEYVAHEMDEPLGVEDIQELVEDYLTDYDLKVSKAYIKYRYKHGVMRANSTEFIRAISEKLRASNVQNQNANIDEHSFGGRVGEASDEMMKQYALDFCMSEMARNNHLNNEIYIHDLSAYAVGMHNCLSIPFDDLLAKGFNTRQTDVRPANSINTAFQLVAVIFQLQSLMQFGGVSATHLDWTMVPYVRKSYYKHLQEVCTIVQNTDNSTWTVGPFERKTLPEIFEIQTKNKKPEDISIKDLDTYGYFPASVCDSALEMTKKELQQAVEGMYHNLNTLQSRSGNQLPFTSINYGTCTLPEGRMVIRALLEGSIKGVGKYHKTPIFPCGIFQLGKGINRAPGDPNYDLYLLALESTAKRIYPNYANIDWSGNAGYDPKDPTTYFSTMGCRTANGADINAEPGVNPQRKDGRGNICPVTIIMPTLAMEIKQELDNLMYPDGYSEKVFIDAFMGRLDKKIHEAKDMLLERFEWICKQSPASAKFMYENNTMLGYHPEEGIRSALKHGTIVIGQLGLAETLQILIGCDHTTEKGMALAKRIEQLFKDRCAEFKKEYKLNFGVYYTPAENLCYTAMKKFKAKYGEIENVSDHEYFTNSIHVPVWHDISVFDKIDIESQLTGYSSAGCITYVEVPSGVKNNIPALETIVNYAMDHDIPYFAVNIKLDMCEDCGFQDEISDVCPECGSTNIQHLRRVTGYLTGNYKTAFNYGKQCETEQRVEHIH